MVPLVSENAQALQENATAHPSEVSAAGVFRLERTSRRTCALELLLPFSWPSPAQSRMVSPVLTLALAFPMATLSSPR